MDKPNGESAQKFGRMSGKKF